MKLKQVFACLLALLLGLSPLVAYAETSLQDTIDSIYIRLCGDVSLQEWIDGHVAANAGSITDSYILNLNQFDHNLDLSAYVQAAGTLVQGGEISNPVSRMRSALALISCERADLIPASIADDAIGKLGLMSYVYGLHLLNNGVSSRLWTPDSITEKLLALQKPDGGWAVTGHFGDIDATAMCLQALACCEKTGTLQEAIDRAVEFLSSKQLDNGGFISMGRENSESAAQVILTLASLGIDPISDARFVKAGGSAVDALLAYRCDGGGFSHLPGEAENETASAQALCALTALLQPGAHYFDFSRAPLPQLNPVNTNHLPGWKLYVLIAIAILAIAGCIFALTRRHGRIKQLAFALLLAAIAAAAVLMIDIQSTASYYGDTAPLGADGEVYLSIRCDSVAGLRQDGSTPEDGIILERTAMSISAGDSLFDVMTDAARRFGIHMEHEGGAGDLAYIDGINYLYEYAYGELSGWVYTVNGERLSIGCGAFIPKNGDEIVWHYTLELGEDIQ